jgi:hypothetical protein
MRVVFPPPGLGNAVRLRGRPADAALPVPKEGRCTLISMPTSLNLADGLNIASSADTRPSAVCGRETARASAPVDATDADEAGRAVSANFRPVIAATQVQRVQREPPPLERYPPPSAATGLLGPVQLEVFRGLRLRSQMRRMTGRQEHSRRGGKESAIDR